MYPDCDNRRQFHSNVLRHAEDDQNEETYIFRTYWKSFRENFKQATAIWLILLAVLIVLILDLLLVMRMPGTITYLRFVFLVLIFFEAMVLSYVFPVLSRFDNTVKTRSRTPS